MIGSRDCGSTFCGLLIDKDKKVAYLCNLGDSACL